jgi:uncharacterized protein YqeY
MAMLERLTDEMKTALKAGNKDRLGVIRMLLAEVKNIDLNPAKPTAEQVVEGYAKKLKKSVEEYEKIGKADEVAKLRSEIAVVEEFLPKKLSREETEKLIDTFLSANSFAEKDAGKATGLFMKQHGGEVDASLVNPILRAKLAGK